VVGRHALGEVLDLAIHGPRQREVARQHLEHAAFAGLFDEFGGS
jgi:hypothetical protein